MKTEPTVHLFFIDPGPKQSFLKRMSEIFQCEIEPSDEDEYGREWKFEVLGFYFILSLHFRHTNEMLQDFYTLAMQPLSKFRSSGDYVFASLDDHFQALLRDAGFEKVLTEKEFGEYLDQLGFD